MSNPTGIEAAARECWGVAVRGRCYNAGAFREIIARHCVGAENWYSTSRERINHLERVLRQTQEDNLKMVAACEEYRKKVTALEDKIKSMRSREAELLGQPIDEE
jgi:hypothetical protein